jgi:hypothetical protein
MYACAMLVDEGRESMPRSVALVRKSFFVEPRALRRAKRVLGVRTEAEVVRRSIEQVVEQEEFWRFMMKSRGRLARGSFESA